MPSNQISLPFRRSTHRQILDAQDNVVCEIRSGGCGIAVADEIEQLIVTACNSHDALLTACEAADQDWSNTGEVSCETMTQIRVALEGVA